MGVLWEKWGGSWEKWEFDEKRNGFSWILMMGQNGSFLGCSTMGKVEMDDNDNVGLTKMQELLSFRDNFHPFMASHWGWFICHWVYHIRCFFWMLLQSWGYYIMYIYIYVCVHKYIYTIIHLYIYVYIYISLDIC